MKKPMSARAFLLSVLCYTLAFALVAGGVMFAVDPFLHYHNSPVDYALNERFCKPGMLAHYIYDAALIGSSMSQNFDMDGMEAALGGEILKATKSGLRPSEAADILSWLNTASKPNRVYLGLDLAYFNEVEDPEPYYPEYLSNKTVLDDYRYLFGYEAWMRYLPVDVALIAAETLHISLPASIRNETQADLLGRWAEHAVYPGEEQLIADYLNGQSSVSDQNTDGINERMEQALNAWLDRVNFDPEVSYTVFLAPYSALYWVHSGHVGTLDAFLDFRVCFAERLSEYDNVTLFDFQAIEETLDLSLYKDITHYDPCLNDKMTDSFATGAYRADPETVRENNATIREHIRLLTVQYPALKAG